MIMPGTSRHDQVDAQGGIGNGEEGEPLGSPNCGASDTAGPARGILEEQSKRWTLRQDKFDIGDIVRGQWTDGKWYPATVTGLPQPTAPESGTGMSPRSYAVRYSDGRKQNLPQHRVMRNYTDLSTNEINRVDDPQGSDSSIHRSHVLHQAW